MIPLGGWSGLADRLSVFHSFLYSKFSLPEICEGGKGRGLGIIPGGSGNWDDFKNAHPISARDWIFGL